MRFTKLYMALLAFFAAGPTGAAIIKVEVGRTGLRYAPDNIKAAKGDIVEFHFDAMHSVVAGDFAKPCTPVASGGFYSGFLPSGDESFFSITIENTDPIFFYCAVDSHCQGGMVGVINQGSDTLDAYRTAAIKTDNTVTPNGAFGGNVTSSPVTSVGTSSSTPTSTESKPVSTESKSASTESKSGSTESRSVSTESASASTETASHTSGAKNITSKPVSASTESNSVPFATSNATVSAPTGVTSKTGATVPPTSSPTSVISSSPLRYFTSPVAGVACLAVAIAALLAL
ncbi:hypothetical protein VFPPC_05864 [Pochonia chlamydosporia 170]|uniref:Extracellular serine-rich protein n=1 Tax=Pochonia chlamydosporia 170 TaxID=1380566 RepID=A0A179FGE3_METCM|nr:hypothetical protein VFPPC_05864 [Pochonia chlamydosporia 170]OAQ64606.1 hypothetical protein VFPPC_05864 [Pochonia chlamydosporia 170]